MREIRLSGSMSGKWKRSKASGILPQRGNPETDVPTYTTAPLLDSTHKRNVWKRPQQWIPKNPSSWSFGWTPRTCDGSWRPSASTIRRPPAPVGSRRLGRVPGGRVRRPGVVPPPPHLRRAPRYRGYDLLRIAGQKPCQLVVLFIGSLPEAGGRVERPRRREPGRVDAGAAHRRARRCHQRGSRGVHRPLAGDDFGERVAGLANEAAICAQWESPPERERGGPRPRMRRDDAAPWRAELGPIRFFAVVSKCKSPKREGLWFSACRDGCVDAPGR